MLAVIGGSGIYDLEETQQGETFEVETPFGRASDLVHMARRDDAALREKLAQRRYQGLVVKGLARRRRVVDAHLLAAGQMHGPVALFATHELIA